MNIANKLTILRIALIPFFILPFHLPFLRDETLNLFFLESTLSHLVAFVVFILAASTDWLDGYLARKHNLITDFGKFMDPLADKILTTAAFLIFIDLELMTSWMVFIILTREFIVSGFRLTAASKGVVIPAAFSGKLKTVLQFITIIILLIFPYLNVVTRTLINLTIFLTATSGAEYVLKNIELLKE